MTFPTIYNTNLLRKKLSLRQDLKGKFNLIFIPFEKWQQMELESWMALAIKLEEKFDGLFYYELPTIQSKNSFYRIFTNECSRLASPTHNQPGLQSGRREYTCLYF